MKGAIAMVATFIAGEPIYSTFSITDGHLIRNGKVNRVTAQYPLLLTWFNSMDK